MTLLLLSVFFFFLIPVVMSKPVPLFFFGVAVMASLLMIIPLIKYPGFMAVSWRLKATNQMVIAIFYLVTYMRQSPNLERAFEFASGRAS